jgi:tetratricopeptide (TPR) repeat protein
MNKQSSLFKNAYQGILFLCFCTLLGACSNSTQEEKFIAQMYKQSIDSGDYATAAGILEHLPISDSSTKNSHWQDSLAYVYLKMENYGACESICTKLLQKDSFNVAVIEMLALSLHSQGKIPQAAQAYQRLVPKSRNVHHAYTLAQLQFELNQLSSSLSTVHFALSLSYLPSDWVEVYLFQENKCQQVPVEAALAYLKGLILGALNPIQNNQLAKEAYEEAIQLAPDFLMAKKNLADLTDAP